MQYIISILVEIQLYKYSLNWTDIPQSYYLQNLKTRIHIYGICNNSFIYIPDTTMNEELNIIHTPLLGFRTTNTNVFVLQLFEKYLLNWRDDATTSNIEIAFSGASVYDTEAYKRALAPFARIRMLNTLNEKEP